jgi:hypothetical protein
VAVFDLGAQADRARAHSPEHLVLPLDLADRPDALAQALVQRLHEGAPTDPDISGVPSGST